MTDLQIARNKADIDLENAVLAFHDHISGLTYDEIATKYGITRKAVFNRLKKAREFYYEQLLEDGNKYFAEIWLRYDYIYREAQKQWEIGKDAAFLAQMRSCLEAFRKMAGIDAPPKASVNEQGKAVQDKWVIVMSEDAYLEKEREALASHPEIIQGESKEV